jgi:methyl-accepting chemotaxis protein
MFEWFKKFFTKPPPKQEKEPVKKVVQHYIPFQEEDTEIEYCLPPDTIIWSVTCPQGKIKDFNRSFLKASGFTPEELYSNNHNILRHSDIPSEVFGDLWKTIHSGLPWEGIVKNRRKNRSQYYWVHATVLPVRKDGYISGFMSIRIPATRNQINTAKKLYTDVFAGKRRVKTGKIIVEPSRKQFHIHLGLLTLLPVLMAIDVYTGYYKTSHLVIAVLAGLYLGNLLRQYHLVDDKDTVLTKLADLANGSFRLNIDNRKPWSSELSLIRANNARDAALGKDMEFDKVLIRVLKDTIRGKAIVTDANFIIHDYSLSSLSLCKGDNPKIKQLSGFNMEELFSGKPELIISMKRGESILIEMSISNIVYTVIGKALNVEGVIEGFLFLFYELGQSKSKTTKLTRLEN